MKYEKTIKLPEHCKLLSDYDDYVLAERISNAGEKVNIEYITWHKGLRGGVDLGHYFGDNLQAAKEDFAKRSRLVNEAKLFNSDELAVLYRGLMEYDKSETIDYEDKKLCEHLENIRDKLERIPDVDIEKYLRISVTGNRDSFRKSDEYIDNKDIDKALDKADKYPMPENDDDRTI